MRIAHGFGSGNTMASVADWSRLVVQNLIPQRCHGKGRLTSRYANQGKAECQD
jgi:hypothetical protein